MRNRNGFTLLEMIISSGIFATIIVIAVGAMLALSQAQVKATNIQNIQDNVRFAIEFMTKELRTGTGYAVSSCGASGCEEINFIRQDGIPVGYCLLGGAIRRISGGGCQAGNAVTSPQVNVSRLAFYVSGQAPGPIDGQPRVTAVIKARSVNPTLRFETDFNLQTTVTQRTRDLP